MQGAYSALMTMLEKMEARLAALEAARPTATPKVLYEGEAWIVDAHPTNPTFHFNSAMLRTNSNRVHVVVTAQPGRVRMIPGASSAPAGERPRLYGVYPAIVTDVQDPDSQGRVQIRLPFVEESDGGSALAWARLATLMAGADRGTWFIPEVDDEVLVAFTAGDPRRPVVIGGNY